MKFEQWVKKQNDEFFKAARLQEKRKLLLEYAIGIANKKYTDVCAGAISDFPYRISTYIKGKKVVTQIINMRKQKRGIAICHENDAFVPEIGIAYAWARYKKESIPDFTVMKKLSEMKNGDVFFDKKGIKCFFVGVYPKSLRNQQCYAIYEMNTHKLVDFWDSTRNPNEYEVII